MASPRTQTANAIAAIHARNINQASSTLQIPDIDFTQHQLENGEVVSTTERVVKDVSSLCFFRDPGCFEMEAESV
jgi:serine/threonine-protein phosphatase 2B catalytic subunit